MLTQKKRSWILAGTAIIIVWLMAATATAGRKNFSDFTPTHFAYLPFVAWQPTPTPSPTPTSTPIPPDDSANEEAIINGLNQQRNSNGLPSLAMVSELTQAARRHSRDMADHNFTDHTGSDGSDGGQRMEEAGYDWIGWGEIIGWGFGGDTTRMIDWWMNSPPHKAIILSNNFTDFGAGYAYNANSQWRHYWTVNFGARATLATTSADYFYTCAFVVQNELGGSSLLIHSRIPCE
jgi:uncharacterized protein YkwD